VELDSIGGLRRLKQWLAQREHSFDPQARDFGVAAPRGVLMLGIQGAGKSLCAKAIATAWQRPLLRMDVGALYDKYVGESERRLRDALRQAEMMAPIVLWIDEIEKAFAAAASQSNDGGLSKRMFGCLLTWMQEHNYPVFLVATANDIEALPPELMRKGRFDEIFSSTCRAKMYAGRSSRFTCARGKRNPQSYELDQLATQTDGFSGAEIEQAVMAGLHKAFAEKRQLTTEDLLEIVRNSPPLSVTMAEKVAGLRRWALDRCVPAD
jgi:SpoVK/Ycf46/Vps4 family AAA+-type ATPase